MQMKTPRLVRIEPKYVENVPKRARYERKQALAQSLAFDCIDFDCGILDRYMRLWSVQIKKPWGRYSVDRFERENWTLFASGSALHPVLICDDYAYAAAPMYDKTLHPWAAKFMWFSLIDWLIADGTVRWLDLGGGSQRTWRQLVENPDKSYKWLYVQRQYRDPVNCRPWRSQVCRCGWRQLVERESSCRGCSPG